MTKKNNFLLTLGFNISSVFVAYFFPSAKSLLSILGAFFGTMIVVTMPGMMMCSYLRNHWNVYSAKSIFYHVWTALFTFLGFACGTYSVLKALKIVKWSI